MSIQPTAAWRVRPGGAEVNGGGFDASISGAGVDYTDQDSPQLALTDIVTVGSTTVTSVTGGFTSNMIGNCLRIVSDNYYFITARASSNSITVDRATGTGTGQTGKVGGAWAFLTNCFTGGPTTQPLIAAPVQPGNTVWIRGDGSNDPVTDTYTGDPNNYSQVANGDTTGGRILYRGYNGRPQINYCGLFLYGAQKVSIQDLVFFTNTSAAFPQYGVFAVTSVDCAATNCKFDTNGVASGSGINCTSIIDCLVTNSGTTSSASSQSGILVVGNGGICIGNKVEKQRGNGISCLSTYANVSFNEVVNNAQLGMTLGGPCSITGNTVDGNGGDGMYAADARTFFSMEILNNTISNNGGYGINASGGYITQLVDSLKVIADYNVLYNNTSGNYNNISAGPHDQNVDPQYVGSGDYTPTNAALAGTAIPESFP